VNRQKIVIILTLFDLFYYSRISHSDGLD